MILLFVGGRLHFFRLVHFQYSIKHNENMLLGGKFLNIPVSIMLCRYGLDSGAIHKN